MAYTNPRKLAWVKRKKRVRKKVRGTGQRPRLCVFRSARHIYAQIIDDDLGKTLACASTMDKELRGKISKTGNIEAAKMVGELIGKKAKTKGIDKIVFDRNGFLYHGRVRALAENAREAGLKF
ncbi:50S ribosomal protein L18 [Thermodesulfobacteriota bacterium]